jgi:hypothetical protein
VSRQPNKKWKYRIILIFLCAAIGGWFGWWLATPFFIPGIGTIQWPFPPATTIVVCALIAGLVGCVVVCWCCTKDDDGRTPLHGAASNGHKEIAERLLSKGADVDAMDDDGWTPLHYAASNGHKEIAELLLSKGADVDVKVVSGGHKGKTPLDAANETNHPEIIDLLRKHGGKTGEELKAEGK